MKEKEDLNKLLFIKCSSHGKYSGRWWCATDVNKPGIVFQGLRVKREDTTFIKNGNLFSVVAPGQQFD
jgi:hypothetical protein